MLGNKVMQMRAETVTNDEPVSMVTCLSLNPALSANHFWLMCELHIYGGQCTRDKKSLCSSYWTSVLLQSEQRLRALNWISMRVILSPKLWIYEAVVSDKLLLPSDQPVTRTRTLAVSEPP